MLIGRFAVAVFVLALAGRLVTKRSRPRSLSTMPTTGPTFAVLLIGTLVLLTLLTYLPVLALGPLSEIT